MIDFNVRSYMKSILPDGNYDFKVTACDMKPTRNNPECRFVGVTLEVISGFRKGSRFFDNFNIYNVKDTVQDMGRARFAEFCDAISVPDLKNIGEAMGCMGNANLGQDSYVDKNGEVRHKNVVTKYSKIIGQKDNEVVTDGIIRDEKVPFDDDIAF